MKGVAVIALLAGCLEVPTGPGQECTKSSDCDSGETCSAGLCYGNPPPGMFAATLSAPSSRDDVVATELANVSLPQDGWLGEIQLERPVTISGRVEAYCAVGNQMCRTASIGAQIRMTRPSRIPGAPAVRFSVQSKPELPRGTDSFQLRVPRTLPNDEPWTVTIDPEGGGDKPAADGGTDPAELVPPRRLALYATDDREHQTYTLGDPDPVVITGSLRDAFSNSLTKYRVVALGRWEGETSTTEVSTVNFSTDGYYSVTIAGRVMGPLEIVAEPFDDNDVSPTLHLQNVTLMTQQRVLTQPTGLGQRRMIDLPVQALANTGEVKLVGGVRVIISGEVTSTLTEDLHAVFRAETTTGEDGIAHLAVLDGPAIAQNYALRLVPPASSTYGVVESGQLQLPTPEPVRLPSRAALRGTIVDVHGNPLAAVSVTARRSQRFLWSVAEADQPFLDEIPAATALTPETGEFVVWVDPAVADTWGDYDLFFETPANSPSPNWSLRGVALPRVANPGTITLDTIVIPDAARLHAKIINSEGVAIEGSDLRLFQISSNDNVCMEVSHPPAICVPATVVIGHGESDDKGKLQLTLPRP